MGSANWADNQGNDLHFEGKNQIHFLVPKINRQKLIQELQTTPRDFNKTRREFEKWFHATCAFTYTASGKKKIELSPTMESIYTIPDGYNLFLYLKERPSNISEKDFTYFLAFYTVMFGIQVDEARKKILSGDHDQVRQEELANLDAKSMILAVVNLDISEPLVVPFEIEKKIRALIDPPPIPPTLLRDKEIWGKKREGIGMLFSRNRISLEEPEKNISYLDELLCYFDGMFFPDLIEASRTIRFIWGLWVTARADILADTGSETYKLFCAIFQIPEGNLFEPDGSIRQEVWIMTPAELHDGLIMIQTKKQNKIQAEQQRKELAEATHQRLIDILSRKIVGTYDPNNCAIEIPNIDPEIMALEITILKNGNVSARTTILPPFPNTVNLRMCKFATFNPNKSGRGWDEIAQWKGGENYIITVAGKIGKEKTPENEVYSWREKKEKREEPASSIASGTVFRITTVLTPESSATTKTDIQPSFPVTTSGVTTDSKIPEKDKKEQEKEDLQAALEFFLEKSPKELQDFFIYHHIWNEESRTLTLSIPIKELEEIGYTPQELSVAEYSPMLQWTAQQEGSDWKMLQETPAAIKTIFADIHKNMLAREGLIQEKVRRENINTQLAQLGLQTSRRSTHALEEAFETICTNKQVDLARLETKMSNLGIREQGYRFFHNGSNSITLAKKLGQSSSNEWAINYNWATRKYSITGLENNSLLEERIKNALLRFLVRINEEMLEEMLFNNIHLAGNDKKGKLDLEKGLKERLKKGQANLFIRFRGHDILIPGVSSDNYEVKIAEIQAKYEGAPIYIVYRTFSYALYDGEWRKGQNEAYNQCIENHLDVIQARCRATLAQKASYRENNTNGNTAIQERGPFTNGVAGYCREFFFKKDPFDTEDMREFMEFIHAEGTPEEKRDILYVGVRSALFSDTENPDIDSRSCREFFFKHDPNDLNAIADFLVSLQEKGTNEKERPGEKHVGIVYSSPVLGPISDIPAILAKEEKGKK